MSASIRVADLYASLGVRQDKASWARGDAALEGLKAKLKRFNVRAGELLGSGFSVAGFTAGLGIAAKNAIDFDKTLIRLDVDSQGAMGTVERMKTLFVGISNATGVAKEDVATLAKTFVDLTGKGAIATDILDDMARASVATGASMEDIGTVAATLVDNLGIASKDIWQAFAVIDAAGKRGSVSFKDMADRLSPLIAQISGFSGSEGVRGLADVSAALQIVNRDLKDPQKSATSLSQMMTQIIAHAGDLQGAGVRVFDVKADGTKVPRALLDIVDDLGNSTLAKDPQLLQKALGSDEAARAARAMMRVRGEVRALADEILRANGLTADYGKISESAGARAGRAWNEAKNKLTEAFTPERIELFTGAIIKAVEAAAWLIDKLEEVARGIDRIITGADEDMATAAVRRAAEYKARREGKTPREVDEAGDVAVKELGGEPVNRGGFVPRSERGFVDKWLNPMSAIRDIRDGGSENVVGDALIRKAQRFNETGSTAPPPPISPSPPRMAPKGIMDSLTAPSKIRVSDAPRAAAPTTVVAPVVTPPPVTINSPVTINGVDGAKEAKQEVVAAIRKERDREGRRIQGAR